MKLTALLASAALLLPAAVLVAPAQAAPANHGSFVVRNCWTQKSGVTLRIKFRVDSLSTGRVFRIRVSHPDGTGRFEEPRVRDASSSFASGIYDPDAAADAQPVGDRAVFRGRGTGPDAMITHWVLRNGKRASVTCKNPRLR